MMITVFIFVFVLSQFVNTERNVPWDMPGTIPSAFFTAFFTVHKVAASGHNDVGSGDKLLQKTYILFLFICKENLLIFVVTIFDSIVIRTQKQYVLFNITESKACLVLYLFAFGPSSVKTFPFWPSIENALVTPALDTQIDILTVHLMSFLIKKCTYLGIVHILTKPDLKCFLLDIVYRLNSFVQ